MAVCVIKMKRERVRPIIDGAQGPVKPTVREARALGAHALR